MFLSVSESFGCSEEVLTVAAMLQVQHVFTLPSRAKSAAVSCMSIVAVIDTDKSVVFFVDIPMWSSG